MEAARFREIYQNEANQGGLRTGGRTYGGCEEYEGGAKPRKAKTYVRCEQYGEQGKSCKAAAFNPWLQYLHEASLLPGNADKTRKELIKFLSPKRSAETKSNYEQWKKNRGIVTQKTIITQGTYNNTPVSSKKTYGQPKKITKAERRVLQGKGAFPV